MADVNRIRPRQLTGRLQVQLMELAADRVKDEDISPAVQRWANGISSEINMFDLAFICDCSIDDLMDMDANQLTAVIKDCKKVNPLFFDMLEREKKEAEENQKMMTEKFPDLVEEFTREQVKLRIEQLKQSAGKLNGSGDHLQHSAEAVTEPG